MPHPPYPLAELEAFESAGNYTTWAVSGMQPWIQGSVCEVGAGLGHVTRVLLGLNPRRLVALEPDPQLHARLQTSFVAHTNLTLFHGTLSDYAVLNNEPMDAVLYVNVLEHIEEDVAELELCHSRLRPGGALLVFVPALQALFSEYDRKVGHFRRYAMPELRRKVESSGFRVLKLRYFDMPGALVWWFACKCFKQRPRAGTMGLYDRWVVPVTRALERRCTPPFGKNLQLVAIKV